MGARAVVAKLGFFTNKVGNGGGSSICCLFTRCMTTSSRNADSDRGMKSKKEKNIYLCFTEYTFCGLEEYTSRVIRPIPSNGDEDKEEVLLREAAYKTSKGNLNHFPYSTFGSNIIFPYGPADYATRICRINTANRQLKYPAKDSNNPLKYLLHRDGPYLACFRQSGRRDVVLGEVGGMLYCFNNDKRFRFNPSFPNFELMNHYSSFIWYPLDAPPFLRGKFSPHYSVAFLNESKKILGWELEKPGVFCFDVTKRSDGWTKIQVPLENHGKPFIVHGCNPNIGDFHVMFNYEPDNQPLVVSAFFMSNNFDYFQPLINKPIELPALCSQYLLSRRDDVESDVKHMVPTVSTDFEFVNLGHQQVGLVLHKYFEDDPSQGRNTGIILVVTFEYDVIVSVNNTLEILTRFLGTRRYRYRTRQLRRKTYNSTETCCKFHKEKFDGNYVRDIYSETRQVHLNAAFQL